MIMKDVVISITGVQQGHNGPNAIELVTQGRYGVERDKICLSYQETELTGMDGTETTFTVHPKRVELERKGGVNAQMVFQEGVPHESLYQMPFGALMITVKATSVFFDIVPDGGVIDLVYNIEIENTQAGIIDYHLDIRAKE